MGFFSKFFRKPWIHLVTDEAGWVIDHEASYYENAIRKILPDVKVTKGKALPEEGIPDLVHCASLWNFLGIADRLNKKTKVIANVFHGYRQGDDPALMRGIEKLISYQSRINVVLTACSKMVKRLGDWGFSDMQIYLMYLGVDRSLMYPQSADERRSFREKLGIPANVACIGSFQKDGNGWDEGNEPKLIKGPDLFVESMERIAREIPVNVLLTGPSRGYVKNELQKRGIPFLHVYPEKYEDLVNYYNVLDLYLMCSREEGGPKSVAESFACGIPIVSTKAGLAEDLVIHGKTGMLVDVENVDQIVEGALAVLKNKSLREVIVQNALKSAEQVEMRGLAEKLVSEKYKPMLGL